MRHGGPAFTLRASLLISSAVFAWGVLASAADPSETEGHAAAPTAPTRASTKTAKHKKGKGAPSASADELAASALPSELPPADSAAIPALSASAGVAEASASAAVESPSIPSAVATAVALPIALPPASAAPAPSASGHVKAP